MADVRRDPSLLVGVVDSLFFQQLLFFGGTILMTVPLDDEPSDINRLCAKGTFSDQSGKVISPSIGIVDGFTFQQGNYNMGTSSRNNQYICGIVSSATPNT